MKQYIHRGDIHFCLLLAFFLTWYRVLDTLQSATLSGIVIARLAMNFVAIAVMLEVIFALLCYLRGKSMFGKSTLPYFDWKRILPISMLITAGSQVFYYFHLPSPLAAPTMWGFVLGFVAGTLLTMLYFHSLVKRK